VYATRDGVVAELGYDPVYGNFVVLEHEGRGKACTDTSARYSRTCGRRSDQVR
jgi:murein DD-endopeptidase MepM/ murein hydrolase activator NlpD